MVNFVRRLSGAFSPSKMTCCEIRVLPLILRDAREERAPQDEGFLLRPEERPPLGRATKDGPQEPDFAPVFVQKRKAPR